MAFVHDGFTRWKDPDAPPELLSVGRAPRALLDRPFTARVRFSFHPTNPAAMDADPLATLNLRLADACRVEHHGLLLLEAITANRMLPGSVRDRAGLHRIETRAQWSQLFSVLQLQAPALAGRIAATGVRPLPRRPGPAHWADLERREISACQGVLAYSRHSLVESLSSTCAAAIDLQRSVLLWLEGEVMATAAPAGAPGGTAPRDPASRTRLSMQGWLERIGAPDLPGPAPVAGVE